MFKEVGAGFKPAPTVLFASLVCFVVKFIFWLRLGRASSFVNRSQPVEGLRIVIKNLLYRGLWDLPLIGPLL